MRASSRCRSSSFASLSKAVLTTPTLRGGQRLSRSSCSQAITDYLDGYLATHLEADVEYRPHARPDRRQAARRHLPSSLAAHGEIAGWSLWAGIIILCREILVSGLREYLAALKVSVPVTQLAKWKTTMQMVADRLSACRPGGRQDLPGRDRDRHRIALGVGDRHALYGLRLFPSRAEARHRGIG
jgi:hypothetical protein